MANILIVDDEEDMAYALKKLLEEENYDVQAANCCSEVREYLEEEYFDVIISELFLREEDGFQVLEMVQEIDPELPFIMLIDKESENIAIQALELGAYDYLFKPLMYTDILNVVYKAVEKRTLYVDKVTAEDELETASSRLNCLTSIIEAFSNSIGEEEAISRFLDIIMKNYSATYTSLSVIEDDGKKIKFLGEKSKFEIKTKYKVGESYALEIFPITTQTVEAGEAQVETGIKDLTSKISLKMQEEYSDGDIYCSFMEIPIFYMKEILGTIHIESHSTHIRDFTQNELELAELIAKYTGIAVDNMRLRKK